MNRPDDFDDAELDLQRRLDALVMHEPPMVSLPGDDVQRGRRLVRRRRWGAVGTMAVLVPALAVGAVAATNSVFTGGAAGPDRLVPAGSGDASDSACDPPVLVEPGGTPDFSEQTAGSEPGRVQAQGSTRAEEPGDGEAGEYLVCSDGSDGWSCENLSSADSGGADTADSSGDGKVLSDDDLASCREYTVDSTSTDRMDELDQLLGDTLDPGGTHTGGSSIGGISMRGVSTDSGEGDVAAVTVGRDWDLADRRGAVYLSIFPDASSYIPEGCSDTSIVGPTVTCEQTTLPGGTEVTVGHGQQDGADRLTVAYERPDGTLVIATADEASGDWWEGGAGPDPLTDAPVTADQLAELATAQGAHL